MKYEFTGEKKTFCGVELKRIRAVEDNTRYGVAAGELGGWIESEKNLEQSGNAWVSGDARVYGNAQVYGNARVSGNAQVYGNARVSGNTWVSGDARVSGNTWVYGNARVSGNTWVSGDARVSGNTWVSGDARVYGNARVSGGAWVSGDARVYGDAQVYGNARVYGDARVYGNAWEKSPLYIQGTRYAFYMAAANKVGCGCQVFTFAGWHKFWRRIAYSFNMTEDEQREYVSYFNLACERYGKEQYKIDLTDGSGNEEVEDDE